MTPPAARPTLALVAVLTLAAGGCGRSAPAAGGAHTPKAEQNRKLAEGYAVAAAVGAAGAEVAVHPEMRKKSAGEKILGVFGIEVERPAVPVKTAPPPPAPPAAPPPRPVHPVELAARPVPPPTEKVVVRERVACEVPLPTEAEAEEATLQAAADRLTEAFGKLDPPLEYRPSVAAVKADFLRRDSRLVRPPTEGERAALARVGYAADRVYVEYTVEASAEQVRDIRGRARMAGALKLFGLLAAAAGVGFVFLRLDAWSQGYLTSWLALAAAALAGGAAAAYVFA